MTTFHTTGSVDSRHGAGDRRGLAANWSRQTVVALATQILLEETKNPMDPVNDPIDPAWWAPVFDDTILEEYEAAELLSTHLQRLAAEPAIEEFHKLVLRTLAKVTSAMLHPADWGSPFSPAVTFGARRSEIPSDLTADEVALLARVAPLVERPDLQARVADVAWTYGDRSNVAMLDAAIDAYRAAPLTDDVWFSVGKASWQRAFDLVNRRGADGRTVADEMCTVLKEHVLAGTVADRYRIPDCAETLRSNGGLDPAARAEVAETLLRLAAEAKGVDSRVSRHLEREGAVWLGSSDTARAHAATERVGHTYIDEADARIKTEPKDGSLVEGLFLEKAIATFRTLPRRYRLDNGIEELIENLRGRLGESRETALAAMTRISSDPIDFSESVAWARERVSAGQDRFEALALFATVVPARDGDSIREQARKALEGTIHHIFGSSTLSRDGRKVAARPGSSGTVDEDTIWNQAVSDIAHQSLLAASALILPAQQVLTFEHRFDRDFITILCAESPVVPEGHAALWGGGLTAGLDGDYGTAISVIVPQLEHVVRTLLKRRGIHTLFVDDQTGVEIEKSLTALLEMEEATDVLGEGMLMDLKALLVVQGGPNLRNDIAHGLLDDDAAWGYHSVYVWWFCLRLVLWPAIRMHNTATNQPADTQDATAEEGVGEDGQEDAEGKAGNA